MVVWGSAVSNCIPTPAPLQRPQDPTGQCNNKANAPPLALQAMMDIRCFVTTEQPIRRAEGPDWATQCQTTRGFHSGGGLVGGLRVGGGSLGGHPPPDSGPTARRRHRKFYGLLFRQRNSSRFVATSRRQRLVSRAPGRDMFLAPARDGFLAALSPAAALRDLRSVACPAQRLEFFLLLTWKYMGLGLVPGAPGKQGAVGGACMGAACLCLHRSARSAEDNFCAPAKPQECGCHGTSPTFL